MLVKSLCPNQFWSFYRTARVKVNRNSHRSNERDRSKRGPPLSVSTHLHRLHRNILSCPTNTKSSMKFFAALKLLLPCCTIAKSASISQNSNLLYRKCFNGTLIHSFSSLLESLVIFLFALTETLPRNIWLRFVTCSHRPTKSPMKDLSITF